MKRWLALMNESGSRTVGFCNQYITVNYKTDESAALIDFLCADLSSDKNASARAVYDVVIVGKKPMMSLWEGDKQHYFGDCKHSLAYALVNEIIYQCITDNDVGHAIHAAAIHSGGQGVLIPGNSGSGKSTFVTWLTTLGCNYLTDELVILAGEEHRIHPFTRPISIRAGSAAALSPYLSFDPKETLAGDNGFMLPHRLANADFSPSVPPLSFILFPQYKADAAPELIRLSSGMGCTKLLECYVNARNLQGHGISQIAALTRDTPVFQLVYGSFEGLEKILREKLGVL
jgi:hypothetical protein